MEDLVKVECTMNFGLENPLHTRHVKVQEKRVLKDHGTLTNTSNTWHLSLDLVVD